MKKKLAFLLALAMSASLALAGCTSSGDSTSSTGTESTESTESGSGDQGKFIADRTIKAHSFVDDLGFALPSDQTGNPVAAKIKEITGISLEWTYTQGDSDLQVMTPMLASGDIPDLIFSYLNNSMRPEFDILMKAAREGLFTDVSSYLKQGEIYSKYFEDGYLSVDTKERVMFRDEFGKNENGDPKCYLVHIDVKRNDDTDTGKLVGGSYLRKDIADELKINVNDIKTADDFYNVCKKIKEGNYKDLNGAKLQAVVGPRYWGGNWDQDTMKAYKYGTAYENGKVTFEIETDNVEKDIAFQRKMLAEDLYHKEIFTMDQQRAGEGANAGSWAIVYSMHSRQTDLLSNCQYVPLTAAIPNVWGDNSKWQSGKGGYCVWAVGSKAEKPEEIVKFLDFLATKEGKLLCMYGIEGKDYDLNDEGFPVIKKEVLDLKDSNPTQARELGFRAAGCEWGWLCATDVDNMADFGELAYGELADPDRYKLSNELYAMVDTKEITYPASAYAPWDLLADLEDSNPKVVDDLRVLEDSVQNNEFRTKAIFANSDDECQKIIDNRREQYKKAGLETFREYLQNYEKDHPDSIRFDNKLAEYAKDGSH